MAAGDLAGAFDAARRQIVRQALAMAQPALTLFQRQAGPAEGGIREDERRDEVRPVAGQRERRQGAERHAEHMGGLPVEHVGHVRHDGG